MRVDEEVDGDGVERVALLSDKERLPASLAAVLDATAYNFLACAADVSDAAQVAELLRGADEVEELLRENVVQGRLNERDNYAFKVKGANEDDVPDHVAEPVSELEIGLAAAEQGKAR